MITLANFAEGNLLLEYRNGTKKGNKYDDRSILTPLNSEAKMNEMPLGDESDAEPMQMGMLEDIHDGSESHPRTNRRE